jgi:hypothetical protein
MVIVPATPVAFFTGRVVMQKTACVSVALFDKTEEFPHFVVCLLPPDVFINMVCEHGANVDHESSEALESPLQLRNGIFRPNIGFF